MPSTIASPGAREPSATFDEPFELLAACHERVRRSLALLARLVDHVERQGADPDAREAAADVLRYFTLAAPAHHEDEERHVVPVLRASGDPALAAAADRLLADHAAIRLAWADLQPLLRAVADGSLRDGDEALLRDAAERFTAPHDTHLPLEDELAFPQAQQRVGRDGPAALRAMGREMAARRHGGG